MERTFFKSFALQRVVRSPMPSWKVMSGNASPRIINIAPNNFAKITFPKGNVVQTGAVLTADEIQEQPEVSWIARSGSLYTLLFLDADAVLDSMTNCPQICHWLVTNIPGDQVCLGQTIIEYHGTKKATANGLHRHLCLVFHQMEFITTGSFVFKITKDKRIIINAPDLITNRNLGYLVAGNYYKAKY